MFDVEQNFVGVSLNHTLHTITKDIANWEIRWPDDRGDMVAEVFSQPRLGSLACVAWRKDLYIRNKRKIWSFIWKD